MKIRATSVVRRQAHFLLASAVRLPAAGAALTAVFLLLPAPRAQGVQDLLASGLKLVEAGKIEEALAAFDLFKQRDPKDIRPYIYSGAAMMKAGRKKDADIELHQATDLKPASAKDALAYAKALEELEQEEAALDALAPWRDKPDLSAEGLSVLSRLYYQCRKFDEALAALEKYAARNPGDSKIDFRRGQIQLQMGSLEPALTSFEKAIRIDPKDASAFYEMAQTLRFGNNLEAAKRIGLMALELDAGNAEYLHFLGLVCGGLKQYAEAIRYFEQAGRSPKRFSRIYFDLGNAYRLSGNQENARKALATYRELHDREESQRNRTATATQLVNQGMQQISKGEVGEGRQSLMRVLETDPDNWQARILLIKIYLSSHKEAMALPHLERVLELDPQSSEANFLMALYWYALRDMERALTYARKSKALRPGHADLRHMMGNLLLGFGKKKEALEEYAAAAKLMPERADFRASYEALAKEVVP